MTKESLNENSNSTEEFDTPDRDQKRSALMVVFPSWSTPVLGILMLIVGLISGYYGRQFIHADRTVPAVEEIDSITADNPPSTPSISDEEMAARQEELMALVVDSTRHFRGEPDAPVTIIEFSDFL
jgi:hypothetical protein